MRIAAISNYADIIGGGELSFIDLISRLDEKFHTIALVPSSGEVEERLRKSHVPVYYTEMPQIRPWTFYRVIASIYQVHKILLKTKRHIIYANGSRACFYGGIAGKLLKIPVIWHCRIDKKDPLFDPILVRLAIRIVANSIATANRFSGKCPNKVKIIYNGIDVKSFHGLRPSDTNEIKPGKIVILCVARISRTKRHDIILKAFDKLAGINTDAHLIFLGNSDSNDESWQLYLKSLTKKSKYFDRIHWHGFEKDVRPWISIADVVVSGSEEESFGRTIVEAMAMGLPIVAVRCGGITEIMTNGVEGFLVNPADFDQMAEKILQILNDSNLYKQMSINGLKRSENFSIERHVDEMKKIFLGNI